MRQNDVYICDYLRTPKGKFGGSLSSIRTDDLAALPRKQLMLRYPNLEWEVLGDLVYGCANQAGEGNRSVERMALLLAGMPSSVSGTIPQRRGADIVFDTDEHPRFSSAEKLASLPTPFRVSWKSAKRNTYDS